MKNNSDKLVWFVAGASIGATLAILFAPQSGEETRRLLGEQARKSRDKVADASREAFEKGRGLYEQGREMAEEAADAVERGIGRARRGLQG
ncbi:MAG: YtxH domain-containing protein [Acidobacteriota bacterium]